MEETGVISKTLRKKRYYEITIASGETVLLFFEKLEGQRFIQGDILSIETIVTEKFGLCALNPVKIGNQSHDELKYYLESKDTIKAYIYNKNEGGYEVSYNSYRCFLPNCECSYNGFFKEADQLMDTYQNFKVIGVRDNDVILSLVEDLKSELEQLKIDEIRNFKLGFQYLGDVKSVRGYGLFVNYKYTEGFLHISRIIEEYDFKMSNVRKNQIERLMKQVFLKDGKLLVSVHEVADRQYSLDWDKTVEPNKTLCEQLRKCGLNV
ncbi:MAG: hypothetical protein ACOH2V_05295 [Candidatus Saccharimonadaceae bacterium]